MHTIFRTKHRLSLVCGMLALLAGTAGFARAEQVTLTVMNDTCLVQDGGADDNNFGGRAELLTSNSGTGGANRRFALLRFDLAGLAGQYGSIDSITLKVRLRNGASRAVPTSGQILDIFRVAEANQGWVEGTGLAGDAITNNVPTPNTATYRAKSDSASTAQRLPWAGSTGLNTPGTDYFAQALGSTLPFDAFSGYQPGSLIEIPLVSTEFGLTEMVNDWIAAGSLNPGLLIRGRIGAGARDQIFFDSLETPDAGAQAAQLVINYTPATADPYVAWAESKNLSGADIDPTSDPDGDGAINYLEFALDGSPKSNISDGKFVTRFVDLAGEPTVILTLPVRIGAVFSGLNALAGTAAGVRYEIRASVDLLAWEQDVDEVVPALSAGLPKLSSGYSYRSFRLAAPLWANEHGFFQVAVSEAP